MHLNRGLIFAALARGSLAAFGLTTSSSSYTIDTNGGLVFTVARCVISLFLVLEVMTIAVVYQSTWSARSNTG
jgi:hypothetical protein